MVVNFLLADEINRAPAKVQSALLEVMAERKSRSAARPSRCRNPFLVMATQNPIEQEGVYPLPEAQRDRFLFKIIVGYPTPEEEREIVYRMGVTPPEPKQILDPGDLLRLQDVAANSFVHHALVDYVVRVVTATRTPEQVRHARRARRGSRTARRRVPRSASSPPPGRWRWCAAATTWSRRTSSRSSPTCCATGWC